MVICGDDTKADGAADTGADMAMPGDTTPNEDAGCVFEDADLPTYGEEGNVSTDVHKVSDGDA